MDEKQFPLRDLKTSYAKAREALGDLAPPDLLAMEKQESTGEKRFPVSELKASVAQANRALHGSQTDSWTLPSGVNLVKVIADLKMAASQNLSPQQRAQIDTVLAEMGVEQSQEQQPS